MAGPEGRAVLSELLYENQSRDAEALCNYAGAHGSYLAFLLCRPQRRLFSFSKGRRRFGVYYSMAYPAEEPCAIMQERKSGGVRRLGPKGFPSTVSAWDRDTPYECENPYYSRAAYAERPEVLSQLVQIAL